MSDDYSVMQVVERAGGWGEFFLRLNDDQQVKVVNGILANAKPWMLTKEGRKSTIHTTRFDVPLRRIIMPTAHWPVHEASLKHAIGEVNKYGTHRIWLTQDPETTKYLVVSGMYYVLARLNLGDSEVSAQFQDWSSLNDLDQLAATGWQMPESAKKALELAIEHWRWSPESAGRQRAYYRAWVHAGRPGDPRVLDNYACDAPWCTERTGDDYDGGAYMFCIRHNSILHLGGA